MGTVRQLEARMLLMVGDDPQRAQQYKEAFSELSDTVASGALNGVPRREKARLMEVLEPFAHPMDGGGAAANGMRPRHVVSRISAAITAAAAAAAAAAAEMAAAAEAAAAVDAVDDIDAGAAADAADAMADDSGRGSGPRGWRAAPRVFTREEERALKLRKKVRIELLQANLDQARKMVDAMKDRVKVLKGLLSVVTGAHWKSTGAENRVPASSAGKRRERDPNGGGGGGAAGGGGGGAKSNVNSAKKARKTTSGKGSSKGLSMSRKKNNGN